MKAFPNSTSYFVQRIPADVGSRARGMTLLVPIGESLASVKITEKMAAVRVSLRTADASEGGEASDRCRSFAEVCRAPREASRTHSEVSHGTRWSGVQAVYSGPGG